MIKDKEKTRKYLSSLKSKTDKLMINPWNVSYRQVDKDFYIFDFEPKAPKIYLLGLIFLIVAVVFRGGGWWLSVPLFIMSSSIFWMPRYYYFMMLLGMRKQGMKGSTRYVDSFEVVKRWCEWAK